MRWCGRMKILVLLPRLSAAAQLKRSAMEYAMQTKPRAYTPDEYLALEATAEFRSEYHQGELIPMTGGSFNHNELATDLTALRQSYGNRAVGFILAMYGCGFLATVALLTPMPRSFRENRLPAPIESIH